MWAPNVYSLDLFHSPLIHKHPILQDPEARCGSTRPLPLFLINTFVHVEAYYLMGTVGNRKVGETSELNKAGLSILHFRRLTQRCVGLVCVKHKGITGEHSFCLFRDV